MSALTFQPAPAAPIRPDNAENLDALAGLTVSEVRVEPHCLTPAEAADRRLRVACPGAVREAEREEYMAEHGEEPPEDDDYEPPPWEG